MTEPTPVKLSPAQIKERRENAAKEAVDSAQKRLDRAEKRVTDATALIEKRDQAKKDLARAKRHLAWVESMPVDDEDEGESGETTPDEGVIQPDPEDED
jgi:hypothetical protein